MEGPLVSVVVLSYNNLQYLQNCFESLKDQTYQNYELLMIDNASTDSSSEYVESTFPWVRVIRNDVNLGYAEGNNRGAKVAKGDYLLFLNADTWTSPDMLQELVREIAHPPNFVVAASTQRSYDGSAFLNCGLSADILGYPNRPDNYSRILYSDGASLFIKKSVFEELGGFDRSYFIYGEDLDLGWRALLAGYDVRSVPSATIGHASGGTALISGMTYQISNRRRYLSERNSLRTVLKNYSATTLAIVLPIRLIIMFCEVVMLLLSGNRNFAFNIIRAIHWNLTNLRATCEARYLVQCNRRVGDKIILRRMSKTLALVRSFASIRRDSRKVMWD